MIYLPLRGPLFNRIYKPGVDALRLNYDWNAGYSLSNEMDMSIGITIPLNTPPISYPLTHEYDLLPTPLMLEFRIGF
jgi:hypothetical protein